MCRHLGYLGPSRTVADVLTAGGECSLRTQAWAPRDMRGGGTINADGFGVAWWSPGRGARAYRNPAPIWSDPAVEGVLDEVRSSAVLAAVRSATVGMPVTREACAPFTDGQWAFSHNGRIDRWPDSVAVLADLMPAVELLGMKSLTDSALLWMLVRRRLDEEAPSEALRCVVADVLEAAPESRLNLLLCDGAGLWATAVAHSLSVRVDESTAVVASEPVDEEGGWLVVPDRHLLEARPGHLVITDLEGTA